MAIKIWCHTLCGFRVWARVARAGLMWVNGRWLAALGAILLGSAGVQSERTEIFPLSCGQSDDPCSRYNTKHDCTTINECRWTDPEEGPGKCDRPVYDQLLVAYLLENIDDARIQVMEIKKNPAPQQNSWDYDLICGASDVSSLDKVTCETEEYESLFELAGDGRCVAGCSRYDNFEECTNNECRWDFDGSGKCDTKVNARTKDVNAIGVNPVDTKVYGMVSHKLVDCSEFDTEGDCDAEPSCGYSQVDSVCFSTSCNPSNSKSFFSRIDIDTKKVEYLQEVDDTAHSVAGTFDSVGNYYKFASRTNYYQLYKIENAHKMAGEFNYQDVKTTIPNITVGAQIQNGPEDDDNLNIFDIVHLRGTFASEAQEESYIAGFGKKKAIFWRIDSEPVRIWIVEIDSGPNSGAGSQWVFQNKWFFQISDSLFQISDIVLDPIGDTSEEPFGSGSFRTTKVAENIQGSNKNDGFNCPEAEIQLDTCGDEFLWGQYTYIGEDEPCPSCSFIDCPVVNCEDFNQRPEYWQNALGTFRYEYCAYSGEIHGGDDCCDSNTVGGKRWLHAYQSLYAFKMIECKGADFKFTPDHETALADAKNKCGGAAESCFVTPDWCNGLAEFRSYGSEIFCDTYDNFYGCDEAECTWDENKVPPCGPRKQCEEFSDRCQWITGDDTDDGGTCITVGDDYPSFPDDNYCQEYFEGAGRFSSDCLPTKPSASEPCSSPEDEVFLSVCMGKDDEENVCETHKDADDKQLFRYTSSKNDIVPGVQNGNNDNTMATCCTPVRLFVENRFEQDAETRLIACRRYDDGVMAKDDNNGNNAILYDTVCGPAHFSTPTARFRPHSNETRYATIDTTAPTWCQAEDSLLGWLNLYRPGGSLFQLLKASYGIEGDPMATAFMKQLRGLNDSYTRYRVQNYSPKYHAGCVEPENETLGVLIAAVRSILINYQNGIFKLAASRIQPVSFMNAHEFVCSSTATPGMIALAWSPNPAVTAAYGHTGGCVSALNASLHSIIPEFSTLVKSVACIADTATLLKRCGNACPKGDGLDFEFENPDGAIYPVIEVPDGYDQDGTWSPYLDTHITNIGSQKIPGIDFVLGNEIRGALSVYDEDLGIDVEGYVLIDALVSENEDGISESIFKNGPQINPGNFDAIVHFNQRVSMMKCQYPWFPRGQVVSQACSTMYIGGALAIKPETSILVSPDVPTDQGCADMCTLVPECFGYIFNREDCRLVLDLYIDDDKLHHTVAMISNRVRVRIFRDSDEDRVPIIEQVQFGQQYTQKVTKQASSRAAALAGGPWLVYGYASLVDIANMIKESEKLIIGKDGLMGRILSKLTTVYSAFPEKCGEECSQTFNCLYGVWIDRNNPCTLILYDDSTAPRNLQHAALLPDLVSKSPSRCREVTAASEPEYSVHAKELCESSPLCTYTKLGPGSAEYGCLDLQVSREFELPFTVGRDPTPVIFAVPDPIVSSLVHNEIGGAAWCGPGRVCQTCTASESLECALTETIIVPPNVTSVDHTNFANCSNLKRIVFTASSVHMQNRSLSNCSKLEKVQFFDPLSLADGANAEPRKHRFDDGAVETCVGPAAKKFGFSTVPNDHEEIKCNTCSSCKILAAHTDGTWSFDGTGQPLTIAEGAFSDCQELHVYDANDAETIRERAFMGASVLGTLNIPKVEEILESAFYETYSLRTIGGGNKLKSIGKNAFYLSGFNNIFPVSNDLIFLGEKAFQRASLFQFDTGTSLEVISREAFSESLISVALLGESVSKIEYGAFKSANNLFAVEIVSTVLTFIGLAAFSECTALEKFYIPKRDNNGNNEMSMTVYPSAFANTQSLGDIHIPGPSNQDLLFDLDQAFPGSFCKIYNLLSTTAVEFDTDYRGCTGMKDEGCIMVDGSGSHVPVKLKRPDQTTDCDGSEIQIVLSTNQNIADLSQLLWSRTAPQPNDIFVKGTVETIIGGSVKIDVLDPAYPVNLNLQITSFTVEPRGGDGESGKDLFIGDQENKRTPPFYNSVHLQGRLDLSEVTIKGGTQVFIAKYAFYRTGYATADLTAVGSVDDYAFADCQLVDVNFGSKVTTIGKSAFDGCKKLTRLYIDNEIGGDDNFIILGHAFAHTPRLQIVHINYLDGNKWFGCSAIDPRFNYQDNQCLGPTDFFNGATSLSTFLLMKLSGPYTSKRMGILDGTPLADLAGNVTSAYPPMSDTIGDYYNNPVLICQNEVVKFTEIEEDCGFEGIDADVNFCLGTSACRDSGYTQPSTLLKHHYVTPVHIIPPDTKNANLFSERDFDMEASGVLDISCIPCEASDTAKYREGRSVIPFEIQWINGPVLKDCPTVTSVSVPATTKFRIAVRENAFMSPVLTRITVTPPPAKFELHHSYVARCLMDHPGISTDAQPREYTAEEADAFGGYGSLK